MAAQMETLSLEIGGQKWQIQRPGDLETLWAEMDVLEEDKIPYWVEVWPAAKLLGEYIFSHADKIKAKRGVEVGCGLGLVSLIAKSVGAKMFAFDYTYEALSFARKNARINGVESPLWLQMDWRKPALKEKSFDFLLASDVLYEKIFFEVLHNFFQTYLKDAGFIWLSNPNREVSKEGVEFLKEKGWQVLPLVEKKVKLSLQSPLISIWELRKQGG